MDKREKIGRSKNSSGSRSIKKEGGTRDYDESYELGPKDRECCP